MIENVLAERGARYGKFADHARIAQGLQEVLHNMPNWPTMDYDMRQALVVITDKIARIGNGDPFYGDNWVDIIGYSTLVLNRINMIEPEAPLTLFDGSAVVEDAEYVVGQTPPELVYPAASSLGDPLGYMQNRT